MKKPYLNSSALERKVGELGYVAPPTIRTDPSLPAVTRGRAR
jgi:hypothetical protein